MNLFPELYQFLESTAPFLTLWLFLFSLINLIRIIRLRRLGGEKVGHNRTLTELAGLPLTLLQTAAFFRALGAGDVISMFLFLWWGPGFFATVFYIAWCRHRRKPPNWLPGRHIISWACKLNYLACMIVFAVMDAPAMIFVFSAWVINDQFGLAFLSLDADRLRRTFHDYWIIRLLYPLGLFLPAFASDMPLREFCALYGIALFLAWMAGILHVKRRVGWNRMPDDPTLLRNMVYFADPKNRGHPESKPDPTPPTPEIRAS
jgi:hypothetical protein